MPQITITFQEGTETPVSVVLNESTAAILDKYVLDQTNIQGEPIYSGKADLFMKHTQESLIEPLIKRYAASYEADTIQQIAALEIQKKQLEAQLRNKFAPVLIGATGI